MAKTTIEAEVKLDDKGNLKKTAAGAQKAADGLERTASSARNADRNIKGVAAASSSSTKNFSKMSQGMGGLVGAYATFAAQMFALTAAFGFLKRAGDLQQLQSGQQAYTAATGVAMRVLAKDIQEATNAQINFRDASQAAAIGVAAGLSPGQLKELGTAAKDVSKILGRDVTDSFNRLIRGVTKAEPELLDELGIILRLDTATQKYADTLNKGKDDLNSFERSQAVVNEVLEQARDKYGRINEIIGGDSANQFTQLGVVMSEIADEIALYLLPAFQAVGKILIDTPALALASFGLLIAGPIRAMGFSVAGLGETLKEFSADSAAMSKNLLTASTDASVGLDMQKNKLRALTQEVLKSPLYKGESKVLTKIAGGGRITGFEMASLKTAVRSAETQLKSHDVVVRGIFKGMNKAVVAEYAAMLTQMGLLEKQKQRGTIAWAAGMKGAIIGIGAAGAAAGAALLAGLNYLTLFIAAISIGYIAFEAIKGFLYPAEELSNAEKSYKYLTDRIKELNDQMKHTVEIQKILLEDGAGYMGTAGAIATLGNQLGMLSQAQTTQLATDLASARKVTAELQQYDRETRAMLDDSPGNADRHILHHFFPFEATKTAINAYRREFGRPEYTERQDAAKKFFENQLELVKLIRSQGNLDYKPLKQFQEAVESGNADNMVEASTALQGFGTQMAIMSRNAKAAKDGMTDFYSSLFKTSSAENQLKNLRTAMNDLLDMGSQVTEEDLYNPIKRNALGIDNRGLDRTQQAEYKALEDNFTVVEKTVTMDAKHQVNSVYRKGQLLRLQNKEKTNTNDLAIQNQVLLNLQGEAEDKIEKIQFLQNLVVQESKEETNERKRSILLLKEELLGLGEKIEGEEKVRDKLADQLQLQIDILKTATAQELLQTRQKLLAVEQKQLDLLLEQEKLRQKAAKTKITRNILETGQTNPFAFLDEQERRLKMERDEARRHAQFLKDNEQEMFDTKKRAIDMEYKLAGVQMAATKFDLQAKLSQMEKRKDDPDFNLQNYNDTIALIKDITDLTSPNGLLAQNQKSAIANVRTGISQGIRDAELQVDLLEDALRKLGATQEFADGIAQSINSSLTNAMEGFIMGTMNAKDAFKSFASSVIADMARIASQQAASAILGSVMKMFTMGAGGGAGAGGGSIVEGSDSFIDIFSDDMYRTGGYTRKGYSTGGVARGPDSGYTAVLHGNEAVVPLPDGRRIPVQLQGGGGVNNITVNVSSDGQTQTQGSSSAQAAGLGRAIALAVQKEIQQQKRSGGMLSPYGAA